MIEGQDDECAPCFVDVHQGAGLFHIGGIVAVSEHHALGVGSSAAGVGDGGIVVVLYGLSYGQELLHGVFIQELVAHLEDLVH